MQRMVTFIALLVTFITVSSACTSILPTIVILMRKLISQLTISRSSLLPLSFVMITSTFVELTF